MIERKRTECIIIHCSDSKFGDANIIREWHIKRGWRDIGYHFVILNGVIQFGTECVDELDGIVEVGRSLMDTGAHCKGYNAKSIGICLIGVESFTPNQLVSLRELVQDIQKQFNDLKIYGHYELDDKKTCPNIDMDWLRNYNFAGKRVLRRSNAS